MGKSTFDDRAVLDFCAGGKTSNEIADFTGYQLSSVYIHLRRLEKSGHLERLKPDESHFGGLNHVFITAGSELSREKQEMHAQSHQDDRQHQWSEEFIRVAHNPFKIGANR